MRPTKLPRDVDLDLAFPHLVDNYKNSGPCLLISRETGVAGSAIAQRIAQRFGWSLFDKQIVDELATRYGTSPEFLSAVDEKHVGWLTDIFYGWLEGHGFSQLAYVHRLHLLFNTVAKQGNAVIVGRGARFVLPRSSSFSVRIVASFDYRVQHVIVDQGLTLAGAQHYVEQSDRERNAFLKKYFHQDVSDPLLHDLVVNVEQLGEEQTLTLIETGLNGWLEQWDRRMSQPRRSHGALVADIAG